MVTDRVRWVVRDDAERLRRPHFRLPLPGPSRRDGFDRLFGSGTSMCENTSANTTRTEQDPPLHMLRAEFHELLCGRRTCRDADAAPAGRCAGWRTGSVRRDGFGRTRARETEPNGDGLAPAARASWFAGRALRPRAHGRQTEPSLSTASVLHTGAGTSPCSPRPSDPRRPDHHWIPDRSNH